LERWGGYADWVEHLICMGGVGGRRPFASSPPAGRPGGAPVAPGSSRAAKESGADVEGCPSGQREQTVNLPAYAFEGSNPSPSTSHHQLPRGIRGNSSVVERQPSKLRVAGSNPVSRSIEGPVGSASRVGGPAILPGAAGPHPPHPTLVPSG